LTKNVKLSEVTSAEARKSAIAVACVLSVIATWNLYRGRVNIVIVFYSLAGVLVLLAWLTPTLARYFHVLWMRLAGALGYVNSRILLSLVFYLIFVPYNLVMRIIGRDPLNRRKAGCASYWVQRKTTRQSKEQFERLF
jgi:hypothetical protein